MNENEERLFAIASAIYVARCVNTPLADHDPSAAISEAKNFIRAAEERGILPKPPKD